MMKKITWAIITCAALTACAQPVVTNPGESLIDAPQGNSVSAAPISAGASDDIGGFIPKANQSQHLMQEASAEPTH